MTTRGIGEIPIGIRQAKQPILSRRTLVNMREVTLRLQSTQAPPAPPTNLTATAQGLQNLVQWTRSSSADFHELLIANSPDINTAIIVNVGNTTQYTDGVGQSQVKRFYWLRAAKSTGFRSTLTNYVAATTLTAGGVTPPTPPPNAYNQPKNLVTGHVDIITQGDKSK